jgi:hypothetical protein
MRCKYKSAMKRSTNKNCSNLKIQFLSQMKYFTIVSKLIRDYARKTDEPACWFYKKHSD